MPDLENIMKQDTRLMIKESLDEMWKVFKDSIDTSHEKEIRRFIKAKDKAHKALSLDVEKDENNS